MKPFNEKGGKTVTQHKTGEYILHGDVILMMVDEAPSDFDSMTVEPNNALAYGELSGHVHQIVGAAKDFSIRLNPTTKERHLKVINPVMLKHQEHEKIHLPPGNYKIGIQREYDPFTKLIRSVAD